MDAITTTQAVRSLMGGDIGRADVWAMGWQTWTQEQREEFLFSLMAEIMKARRERDWQRESLANGIYGYFSAKVGEQGEDDVQQEEQPQPKQQGGKRGRPKATDKPLRSCFYEEEDADKHLPLIREYCKGKKGRKVALIFFVLILGAKIEKPTYGQVVKELGDIGSESGYYKYLSAGAFSQEEIAGMKAFLGL